MDNDVRDGGRLRGGKGRLRGGKGLASYLAPLILDRGSMEKGYEMIFTVLGWLALVTLALAIARQLSEQHHDNRDFLDYDQKFRVKPNY